MPRTASPDIVRFVHERLMPLGDIDRARGMAGYMKTTQPFYGVANPGRVPVFREMVKQFVPESSRAFESNVLTLWNAGVGGVAVRKSGTTVTPDRRSRRDSDLAPPVYAGQREQMYAACMYLEHFDEHHTPARLRLLKRLLIEGGWWILWIGSRVALFRR